MSQQTQDFTQMLGDKLNTMMDNPTLFSVDATEEKKRDDLKNKLISSVNDARTNISDSMKNFRDYYIQTYGNEKWVEFNKNPKLFGTPYFLVTGINPTITTNPEIPENLGFLKPEGGGDYHATPSFYKKMYDIYLKNTSTSALYYAKLTDTPSPSKVPDMNSLYKILQIDLESEIQDRVNNANVNERKSYYERQETDKMKFNIDALRTLYIRIFFILIFIKLYVYFLTQPVSIKGVIIELLTLAFYFFIPIFIAIRVIMMLPKKLFEYLPANVWISNMSS
jgi:hypothetical protein